MTLDVSAFCRSRGDTLTITIHALPRAKRSEIIGLHGDALKVRLAAPPVEGAANEELVRFFSELLGVPQVRVRLQRGGQSRHKVLEIDRYTVADFDKAINGQTVRK